MTAPPPPSRPPAGGPDPQPRVLIVADQVSLSRSGEASLPVHYFRCLRARGVEAWVLGHERTRGEMLERFPDQAERMLFAPDTRAHRLLYRLGKALPARVGWSTVGLAMRLLTQRVQRRMARSLIRQHGVNVVHQAGPVSPKEPSMLHGLGVPLVIGPMNGGMDFPPGFGRLQPGAVTAVVAAGRRASGLIHALLPGKRRAEVLLVANPRTAAALPRGTRGRVVELVENGVDLALWRPPAVAPRPGLPTRFIWVGRIVDWKALDILIDAFARVAAAAPAVLDVVGEGPDRPAREAQAAALGVADRVTFHGWLDQRVCAERVADADVFVLPSLMECGGAVVLEAMAAGKPVIATAWGGPADYLDPSCGVLIPPESRQQMVAGFADAMIRLAGDPALRRRMGAAGQDKARECFDWEAKTDRILQVYREAISGSAAAAAATSRPAPTPSTVIG